MVLGKDTKRILIVEDDPILQKCFVICLKNIGYDPEATACINDVEKKLLTSEYDLLLTDYNLSSGRTGFELFPLLRTMNSKTPVIMVSTCRESQIADRASEYGLFAFLRKPFDLASLAQTCEKALSSIG